MHFLHLTLVFCMLSVISGDPASESSQSSPVKVPQSVTCDSTLTNDVETEATRIIFQSKDGGQTWQDISRVPENEMPAVLSAGAPGAYLRVKKWLPMYVNFEKSVRTIFETSDGTVFLGSDDGLYKSGDKGRTWKRVLNEGWFVNLAEADGVLMATGPKGIRRSTDNGDHWEWVISEGGVGIAIERIDGGFAAITYSTAAESRRVRISLDAGKTWTAIDEGLQPSLSISSIKQMGKYLICGHPDGIFRSSDMGKTWHLVHSGVEDKVFKLYVSGNILYAVARESGC